jgi:RNA polymerase sigma-70 factor (ECF subfamily)
MGVIEGAPIDGCGRDPPGRRLGVVGAAANAERSPRSSRDHPEVAHPATRPLPGRGSDPLAIPVVEILSVAGGHTVVVESGADSMAFQPLDHSMNEEHTTLAVQRYLDELAGGSPAEPIVRALLDRAVRRLHLLCATLLYRSYPRLAQPPLNLQAEEMLGAVAERLLKAMRQVRPRSVREFFALANQHIRWELNDLARRLDEQPAAVELSEGLVPAPASTGSGLSPDGLRMLRAIGGLPDEEREVFDLVRVQGMTQSETAEVLGVSTKTVQRRLNRGLGLLAEQLADLWPGE